MAVNMLVDSTALDAALTATANAIRTKGGTSAQIAWDDVYGFKAAIDAIQTGGGLPSGLNAVAYGTFTPATAGQSLTVTHNLGVSPKGAAYWIPPNGKTGVNYDNTNPLTTGNMTIGGVTFMNPSINNTTYITSEIGSLGEISSHMAVGLRFGANGGTVAASVAFNNGITAMDSTTFTLSNNINAGYITTNTFYYIVWG